MTTRKPTSPTAFQPSSPSSSRPTSRPTSPKSGESGSRFPETAVGGSALKPPGGGGTAIGTSQPDLTLTPGLDADRIKSYDNKKEIIIYAALAPVAVAIVVVATVNTAIVIAFSKSLLTMAAENSEQLLNFAKNPEIYASAAESLCEISASAVFIKTSLSVEEPLSPRSPRHPHFTPNYTYIGDSINVDEF